LKLLKHGGEVFNKLIVALMPLASKFVIKFFSKRYIAGEDTHSAIQKCSELQALGFLTTLDILGESISKQSQAEAALQSYLSLITTVANSGIEKNISLKPTALGLGLSENLAFRNISEIVKKASEENVFIRIDMEDSPYTSQTIHIHNQLKSNFNNLGTVIQAYLHRSEEDVRLLAAAGSNLRICKGIYKESPAIAFQGKQEIRDNFMKLVLEMLSRGAYVGIATHDPYLIDESLKLISAENISKDRYEFQALLGVPIMEKLNSLISQGHKVRIYVPYGDDWYAYSSRRLKENPDIAGYVLKNLFKRNK
jgi:proline dehydrogenase